MNTGLAVALTDEELHAVDEAASAAVNRMQTIPNLKEHDWSKTQYERNHTAILGEFVVAKAFGFGLETCSTAKIDPTTNDRGVDMLLPNGLRAQIKTVRILKNTTRPYWYALNSTNAVAEFTADVGILVFILPNGRTARIVGCVTRERFLREHHIVNLGFGKRAAIASCVMDPVELLIGPDAASPT